MAISVICPSCKATFKVSDKFAGKKGPCPKCKAEIQVPAKQEVVVHEAEVGPKDQKGRSLLKPIFREYSKFSPVMAIGIALGLATVLIAALVLRNSIEDKENFPTGILVIGALLLAPPLVFGGYSVFQNDELAPHKGRDLWVRIAICSVIYAFLWGAVSALDWYLFDSGGFPLPALVIIVACVSAAGAGVAVVSLDLEFFNGLFHYGFYLFVTVLLRVIVGIEAFPYAE